MLPFGFYVICGRQRSGKGSLGTAVMDTDCTYHCAERLMRAQVEVDALNSLQQADPYNLHLPDFPYRSKNKMLLGADELPDLERSFAGEGECHRRDQVDRTQQVDIFRRRSSL